MYPLLITLAALIMGFVGVYMSWLSDLFIYKSLGTHRLVLVVLPTCSALLVAFGIPDQAAVAAWAYAVWAVVTWITGGIYLYARRTSAGIAHARTICTINAWLGVGLAVGGAACFGLVTLGVLR